MAVVVLGSVRSCGTTTLAMALAATWPAGRRVLVVELDPAGGTLAASSGWGAEPSLVSLAAATRRSSDPEAIWAHCRHLPGGASVLAAPGAAEQARGATRMLSGLFARLATLDADVLVDAGRLDPTAPLSGVAMGAARLVLCARPRLSDLNALAAFLAADAGLLDAGRLRLALVGDGPYRDAEIADALGVEVLGRLPWDEGAAECLATIPASDRRLRLSPLVRAARSLATVLAADVVVHAPEAVATSGHDEAALSRRRQGRRLLRPFGVLSIPDSAGAAEVRRDVGIAAGSAEGDGSALGTGALVAGAVANGSLLNGSAPGREAAR